MNRTKDSHGIEAVGVLIYIRETNNFGITWAGRDSTFIVYLDFQTISGIWWGYRGVIFSAPEELQIGMIA